MPVTAPLRYCGPNCNVKVSPLQPCPVHSKPSRYGWSVSTQRIRGRKLQRLRAELYAREPQCRSCKRALLFTADGFIRDHIIPIAEGGTDDESNIQPLCPSCSEAKTQEESRRGVARR